MTLLFATVASAQTHPVHATIDASKTGPPISKYIYGQFLEHGGNIVNEGVWAEMLADRKFCYAVSSKPPEEPPAPAWSCRGPLRYWTPIGTDECASFKLKPIRTVDFRKFLFVTPTLVAIPSEI